MNDIFQIKSIFFKSFLANEPWPADVKLFQPFEVEQVLIHDNSNILAVQGFLNMCNLEYTIEMRANAEHMSPSGKYNINNLESASLLSTKLNCIYNICFHYYLLWVLRSVLLY